jgi:hypothetical protein
VWYKFVMNIPLLNSLIICAPSLDMIQVLEIGSIGKGIIDGHPSFCAHAAGVRIL